MTFDFAADGLKYYDIVEGKGPVAQKGSTVQVGLNFKVEFQRYIIIVFTFSVVLPRTNVTRHLNCGVETQILSK